MKNPSLLHSPPYRDDPLYPKDETSFDWGRPHNYKPRYLGVKFSRRLGGFV